MEKQVAWAAGRPGEEDQLLNLHADTQAYYGRLRASRDLAQRAAGSAERSDAKEAGAVWLAFQAVREAESGEAAEARRTAAMALAMDSGRYVRLLAALALARGAEMTQSRSLLEGLKKSEPTNTYFKVYWFPVIESALALSQQSPDRALIALEPSVPYDLGNLPPSNTGPMYPPYMRGLAYLAQKNGPAAAVEFEKIKANPGIVTNFLLGSLARLQLARAYALAGDAAKAKSEYADFLNLWKEADAESALLNQAQAEYAKLQ
jgi:hypothetical protein